MMPETGPIDCPAPIKMPLRAVIIPIESTLVTSLYVRVPPILIF